MKRTTQQLEIEGRQLTLSNLDKVLFPASGFTKGEIIDYYIRISHWMLPHLKDRPLTLKRYPEGIDKAHFYEKDAPRYTPEWVTTFAVERKGKGRGSRIDYILVNDLPTLVWTANLANIEMHTFLARAPAIDRPTMAVFDLDPGEPAGVLECADVALELKELLDGLKLKTWIKSSGSKGIQVYIPLNHEKTSYGETGEFAHHVARLLEARHPDRVVSEMAKHKRSGKVFIDWSQNSIHKSTVTVYSLRAKRETPYVSVPLEWDEVSRALKKRDGSIFYRKPEELLSRVETIGDLFEPVTKLVQHIPEDYRERLTASDPPPSKQRSSGRRAPAALEAYRAKRDFTQTREPPPMPASSGDNKNKELLFVIQKHAAGRLHYDFRLEMEGVLRSWAVPKGVPTNRSEKRLAMHVEDHPMDYARFEGTIPHGNYGAGTVMVWDIGTWSAKDGHPVGGFYKGKLPMVLHGKKLNGEWTLVRKGRPSSSGGKDEWLLLKTSKDMPSISARRDDTSAISGRSMKQIAGEKGGAVWISNRESSSRGVKEKQPVAAETSRPLNASFADLLAKQPKVKPAFVKPMLAQPVSELPAGPEWEYEIKLDGYRALLIRTGEKTAKIMSRNDKDLGSRYPEIVQAGLNLPETSFVLDGEIVALDPDGAPSFQLLQNLPGNEESRPLYYYAFDLINLGGRDLRKLPLEARKEVLKAFLGQAGASDPIRFSPAIDSDGETLIREVRRRKLEGIVAKRKKSFYETGKRSGQWVKYRTDNEQDFVIGGYKGTAREVESLLAGYYEPAAAAAGKSRKQLRFAGKIRAMSPRVRKMLADLFAEQRLATERCPFVDVPESKSSRWGEGLTKEDMAKAVWLKPRIVCRVQFLEWTAAGHLRHAKFVALRDDSDPAEVRRD